MKTFNSHPRGLSVLGIFAGIFISVPLLQPAKASHFSSTSIRHLVQRDVSDRITGRPGNTKGAVFVVEYHHIRPGKGDMFRPVSEFRKDLENFYNAGFRPVLASEYLSNRMPLAPGALPIVITFDDATPSQVQLLPNGQVDPNCAVGIWQDFARTHPTFPVHATFFILPDVMWSPKRFDARKVKLIFGLGSELANHTMTHPKLSHLTDEQVKSELGNSEEKLESFGQRSPHSLALPYGISPKNKMLLTGFNWKGKAIQFSGVFLVGANPSPSPNSPKFNRYRIPRIMAISGPYGIDFWLRQLGQGHVKPYVQP